MTTWSRNPQRPRVILLGAGPRPQVRAQAQRLQSIIEQHADIVLSDFESRENLSDVAADFVVVLGGDGSILRAASQLGSNQLPVLGVNLGKLGFLADTSPDDLVQVLPDVCQGRCRVIHHLMLRCSLVRNQEVIFERVGLNEAAVLGGAPYSMLNIELYVDSILATTYSCDGLIISTPVGSTAHSLSAGGPILRKDLQAFVISAISPHTLTVRPVVDTADRVYEMIVREPNESTAVVVDGVVLGLVRGDDRVRVERAPQSFQMIQAPGHNYYSTLREKLGWSGNIRTKGPAGP